MKENGGRLLDKKKIIIIVSIVIAVILIISLIIYFNNRVVLDNSGFTLKDDLTVNVYSDVKVKDFIKDIDGKVVDNKKINEYKTGWFEYFEANMPELNKSLNEGAKLSDEDIAALKTKLEAYAKTL